MRAYDIAILLICVVGAVNILAASHFLESDRYCGSPGHNPCDINIYYGPQLTKISNEVQGPGVAPQNDEVLSYSEIAISAFGLLIRSLVAIVLIFGYITLLFPIFLDQLQLPADVNAILTVGVWATYIVGYAQFRSRSTLLGTE